MPFANEAELRAFEQRLWEIFHLHTEADDLVHVQAEASALCQSITGLYEERSTLLRPGWEWHWPELYISHFRLPEVDSQLKLQIAAMKAVVRFVLDGKEPFLREEYFLGAQKAVRSHVVCKWIGNSQDVARKHYLQVTDEHFSRAVTPTPQPVQNPERCTPPPPLKRKPL
jgi:hypothetical protein